MEHQVAVEEESAPSEDRPDAFPMAIQGGMLEALGINMYTTIGKCLVEFVANAYDSDAASVELDIPFDRIAEARREIRAAAKAQAQSVGRTKLNVLLAPLPDDIAECRRQVSCYPISCGAITSASRLSGCRSQLSMDREPIPMSPMASGHWLGSMS
jgi:hypothetical protein